MTLPLFARKFIVDFVETALAAIFGMALVFPHSIADIQGVAAAIGLGVLGALISAARRAAPDFLAWLRTALGTPAS